MRIKNVSNKIINFGVAQVLPNETMEIPRDYIGNPIIDVYEEMDFIVKLPDVAVPERKEDDGKIVIPEKPEALKKAELVKLCEELGIPVDVEDTKSMIVEKIKSFNK